MARFDWGRLLDREPDPDPLPPGVPGVMAWPDPVYGPAADAGGGGADGLARVRRAVRAVPRGSGVWDARGVHPPGRAVGRAGRHHQPARLFVGRYPAWPPITAATVRGSGSMPSRICRWVRLMRRDLCGPQPAPVRRAGGRVAAATPAVGAAANTTLTPARRAAGAVVRRGGARSVSGRERTRGAPPTCAPFPPGSAGGRKSAIWPAGGGFREPPRFPGRYLAGTLTDRSPGSRARRRGRRRRRVPPRRRRGCTPRGWSPARRGPGARRRCGGAGRGPG